MDGAAAVTSSARGDDPRFRSMIMSKPAPIGGGGLKSPPFAKKSSVAGSAPSLKKPYIGSNPTEEIDKEIFFRPPKKAGDTTLDDVNEGDPGIPRSNWLVDDKVLRPVPTNYPLEKSSRFITGKEVYSIVSKDEMESDDEEESANRHPEEHEHNNLLHNLALAVLANSLNVLESHGTKIAVATGGGSSAASVANAFLSGSKEISSRDFLATLLNSLGPAQQKPHDAFLSARCRGSLCEDSSKYAWGGDGGGGPREAARRQRRDLRRAARRQRWETRAHSGSYRRR